MRFSVVYPTRHRPEFVRQALRILEGQAHADFEVIVSDNYVDPALSCESACRDSGVANVRYVRPPVPIGMVENWNFALRFASGDYILYLTDKMFVLPHALARIENAIELAGGPDIVSWTSDFYDPDGYDAYFGEGRYLCVPSDVRAPIYEPYSAARELDRRGRASVSRSEQSPSDYCRGKLVFGAYRRELVQGVVRRYGALFHNINPDYTSMVLGLTDARHAIEMAASCVVSVNTDLSNGMLSDTDDVAALRFLSSLEGGADAIIPSLFVPGLYVSQHNWVAHDFLTLKRAFGLSFELDVTNWLVYCMEDVGRAERRWSDPAIESQQKEVLRAFLASSERSLVSAAEARLSARRARTASTSGRPSLRRLIPRNTRRMLRRLVPESWAPRTAWPSPSLLTAVSSLDRHPGAGARRA